MFQDEVFPLTQRDENLRFVADQRAHRDVPPP